MDSAIEGPSEGIGTLTVNNLNQNTWSNTQSTTNGNPTFLFIAVEYVKDENEFKFGPEVTYSSQETSCNDFEQHVSPLDPNMSSAACYSPTGSCADADISYNSSIVVQQLITSNANQELINNRGNAFIDNLPVSDAPLENISVLPTTLSNVESNLLKDVVNNRFLLNQTSSNNVSNGDPLQLVPDTVPEQEVELLITDQATGISYNVSTQEYLVERCLTDDQQLLDALTPGPLLDSELLTLDDSTLKSQLPDISDTVHSSEALDSQSLISNNLVLSHTIKNNVAQIIVKEEDCDENEIDIFTSDALRRSQRQLLLKSVQSEDHLLSQVHAISDKPVESRAKATLPTSYLAIIKRGEENYGVFARKLIPKRTQFGPLEGILVVNNRNSEENDLQLLIECENGSVHRLDVSDENVANWMCFVRKASNYSEQNLLLSQQGNSLYYTTTTNILPKQELLVGYSTTYARKHNLSVLNPVIPKENYWPCFECDSHFVSSEDLQKHLNVHDEVKRSNLKLKKKTYKNKRKKPKKKFDKDIIECKTCKATLAYPDVSEIRQHLLTHGVSTAINLEDIFSIISYGCDKCDTLLISANHLKLHQLNHKLETGENVQDLIQKLTNKLDSEQVDDSNFKNGSKTQLEESSDESTNKIVQIDGEQNQKITESCNLLSEIIKEAANNELKCVSTEKYGSEKSITRTKDGFKCPVCYKLFASLDRIQRHMLVHGSEESKPLKCDTCHKRFLNNSALACHLKTHSTDKKIYECPMCKEGFDHVLQLKIHVPQHCEDGKYTCPHCKKVFKEYSIIRKHIRAFHCERKHNCPHCGKPFPTLDKLRMHLLRHSDHREFLCADCGKQFKRKDKLKEHTKRMHSEERENTVPKHSKSTSQSGKRFTPKVQPTDYHRFIYKCHACLVGFKRRGMLVNHLAKRHPDIRPDSVPELNLPILRTTRDYYCQYCDKVYKSSSKRKAHILKNHPGQALPMSNRRQGSFPDVPGLPNPTFSQTVGSITTHPQACQWCHKQYASKAKLLQHQRKKHSELLQNHSNQVKHNNNQNNDLVDGQEVEEIVIDTHTFKRDFKVSDEELLSEVVALSDGREDEQYYHIISLPTSDALTFNNTSELNQAGDSRLYRLLTTGNGLLPPR